jgi:hypothetical protein
MESSDLARQFVQHRDLLYGYVFALTRDHDLAEELLQDVGVSILTEATRGRAPDNFLLSLGKPRPRSRAWFPGRCWSMASPKTALPTELP